MIHDVYQKQPIEIIPDWYTKNRSNIISTVAILLMIAHHFFGFRSFFLEEVDYISIFSLHNIEIERIIAAFGKICVVLFAFNSGYVLWKKSADYSNPVKLFNRGFKFLISYWIILAGFWLYALLSEQSIPTGKYLWLNLIGLETGPNAPYINIPFSWYVAYYITFLILAPFLLKAFSRNYICDIISFLCCLSIANISFNYTFLNPLTISATGILFAKYHIFYKVENLFKNHYNLTAFILILVILIPLRQGAIYLNNPIINMFGIDLIIAPIFIFVTIKIFEIIFEITHGGGIYFPVFPKSNEYVVYPWLLFYWRLPYAKFYLLSQIFLSYLCIRNCHHTYSVNAHYPASNNYHKRNICNIFRYETQQFSFLMIYNFLNKERLTI